METMVREWGMYVDLDIGDPALPQNNRAGKSYASYTPNVATRLTDTPDDGVALPADANCAVIVVEGKPVRYMVGDDDAEAAVGLLWFADTTHPYENQRQFLENVSFIDTAAGASRVTVLWGWV